MVDILGVACCRVALRWVGPSLGTEDDQEDDLDVVRVLVEDHVRLEAVLAGQKDDVRLESSPWAPHIVP